MVVTSVCTFHRQDGADIMGHLIFPNTLSNIYSLSLSQTFFLSLPNLLSPSAFSVYLSPAFSLPQPSHSISLQPSLSLSLLTLSLQPSLSSAFSLSLSSLLSLSLFPTPLPPLYFILVYLFLTIRIFHYSSNSLRALHITPSQQPSNSVPQLSFT